MQKQRPSTTFRTGLGTLVSLGVIVTALVLAARNERPGLFRERRALMGTYVAVTISAETRAGATGHLEAAFERVGELEQRLSAHSDRSELRRLVRDAHDRPVSVSNDLFGALQAGVVWHERTGGAFDITVEPLSVLWRQCGEEDRLPTDEELAAAQGKLGIDRIALDEAGRIVRLETEGLSIDLGGLGKGFAADAVATALRKRGIESALIAVAGDIYALGRRPDGAPWHVGVQDPRQPNDANALITTLALQDCAVSTSGDYQRYVVIQGQRYSHIIDPRTGRPAGQVPGVTVIGPDTLSTDILGTALSVLGVEAGLALVERMDKVEALFIIFDDGGEPILTRSTGFGRFEVH